VHFVDLFGKLVDRVLVLLAVRCQLGVVLSLRLVQLFLQLRYFCFSPLRYLRLDTYTPPAAARSSDDATAIMFCC